MFRRFAPALAFWLTAGCTLAAPATGTKSKKESAPEEKTKDGPTDSHKVKRSETLWGIARLHGVSVGDIMDLNHLEDTTLRDGQILKIPRPASDPALAPAKTTTHTLAKGETFRSVARKYGLTQDDLERANPKIDPAAPKVGAKLTIPASIRVAEKSDPAKGKDEAAKKPAVTTIPDDAADSTRVPDVKPKPKTRRYIVSADETPQTISEAFHISVGQLYEINGLKPGSPLKTGMEIQVPNRQAARGE